MPDTTHEEILISSLFEIHGRFLRSAHLVRDFHDAAALEGYVLTRHAKNNLQRLSVGLTPQSGQRAWRITGDYGSGKSSFALFLAHLLSGNKNSLPSQLQTAVGFESLSTAPHLLPVLVVGSEEPLASALLRSLYESLTAICRRGRVPQVVHDIRHLLSTNTGQSVQSNVVVSLLHESARYVATAHKASGLLIILDELGKFLEYAAQHPDRQDVFLLQALAEAAGRSGKIPVFVVGLLHQGFSAYSEQLTPAGQREWEKVAERFEELLFSQPIDQLAELVADALNVRTVFLEHNAANRAERLMESAVTRGWYGPGAVMDILIAVAPRLYPLHPTVLPVLIRLFNRFGQNERSLFNFLLSNEPFGLQSFSAQPFLAGPFYHIHHLYDYARAAFGHRLATQTYRSRWSHINSVIESFPSDDDTELQILKTVGLLNLLDDDSLLPSTDAITLAIADDHPGTENRLLAVLHKLQRGKHALYHRGIIGGYCLWPYTSVNLDRAVEDAKRAVGPINRVIPFLKSYLSTRPLVARRHYISTGNLRHFHVLYAPILEIESTLQSYYAESIAADGCIFIVLCETEQERQAAISFASSPAQMDHPELLVAVPPALKNLSGLVQNAELWQWIAQNTPELNHDTYAAEEVSRQLLASQQALVKRIQSFIGIWQPAGESGIAWFRGGTPVENLGQRRGLLSYLSDVCDEVYSAAPRIMNELVNRRSLSSSAAAARMRLIERMLQAPTQQLLAMDPDKKPPEMSMYLSVLSRAGLHREQNGSYIFAIPNAEDDPCHVIPVLQEIWHLLEIADGNRVRISDVFSHLRRYPFGVRDGLLPILLASFSLIHEHDIAFYENGSFLREVTGDVFLRITKAPVTFDIQLCEVAGVRAELFRQLAQLLNVGVGAEAHLLDIVRPLCIFAAQLPDHTRKTSRLSRPALAIRSALQTTEDPGHLLFNDLPKACGFEPFSPNSVTDPEYIQQFVQILKEAQDELRAAYPLLLDMIQEGISHGFDLALPFPAGRILIADRAAHVLLTLSEPRLKAFCGRLTDRELPQKEWLESIGSLVCAKPPNKWSDADINRYSQELQSLCEQFRRVESVAFTSMYRMSAAVGVRLSVTQPDGNEVERVVYMTTQEETEVSHLEEQMCALLREAPRLGMVAASRALWSIMNNRLEAERIDVDWLSKIGMDNTTLQSQHEVALLPDLMTAVAERSSADTTDSEEMSK